MRKIAVFASGSGSNFQAIVDAVVAGELQADIQLLVCDKPGAKVVDRARKHGIPVFTFLPKTFASKADFEKEIVSELQAYGVEFIVLAGYMRLIGEVLLGAYEGRIVNIHPSYLPAFPGKNAVGQALEANVAETGVTVHYVDSGMDTGPIIEQVKIPVLPGDTETTLQERIQKAEHQLYPAIINKLVQKDIVGGIVQ
ncbi:phosphoribosylglycinamide formyltransferase [Fictibacillus phosphorivorans]|uniref:Phosphoribosylglycinamide formyltransferase n=1 Tax=Fictibacillus phosphorivorans TaxID=1221500 RepID=A0A165N604_9BACL|nr:phosphoribosylglycinamide formyltransferase [Fictibacillus phosphorivorans]KZE64761.1 phosphoribosylglycinamide formyltransferase [Fictibacillus phosphorivorans]